MCVRVRGREACSAWLIGRASSDTVAIAALRQKKAFESELERISGTRLTLETQVGKP